MDLSVHFSFSVLTILNLNRKLIVPKKLQRTMTSFASANTGYILGIHQLKAGKTLINDYVPYLLDESKAEAMKYQDHYFGIHPNFVLPIAGDNIVFTLMEIKRGIGVSDVQEFFDHKHIVCKDIFTNLVFPVDVSGVSKTMWSMRTEPNYFSDVREESVNRSDDEEIERRPGHLSSVEGDFFIISHTLKAGCAPEFWERYIYHSSA